ncbi:Non-heme chloroperoxidase [Corynebacterium endometrii]|uniref:Non-heme chloroperoxidase n=2 Tax=Corynebacterium endometrii TaxID=2488819 RepID=A0A4P7QHB2_9CORY|nr:Non-heme chloroperoxidase [Corynebacterium endometrii]
MKDVRELLHDHKTQPGLTNLDNEGYVKSDGFDIAWFEVGPEDAEATVVFIHGYCLSAESYCDQVEFLRREHPEVRSVLLDVRGHGLSEKVPVDECDVDGAGDDVLAVIKERVPQGNIVIVGHSLGGMIALNVIRRCPQEVYDRISGALLVATSIHELSDKGIARILETTAAELLYNACLTLPDRVNFFRYELAHLVAPVMAALVAGFPQMERIQFHAAMLLDTPLASFAGYFDDLLDHEELAATPRLARLKGEVVVGSMDIVTPESQTDRICDLWPAAEKTIVDGAGHMVILEDPEAISQALERVLQA